MGADVRVVAEVARLFELPDEVPGLIDRLCERCLLMTRREIAGRKDLVRQGRLAAQIDHDVERPVSGQRRRSDDRRPLLTLGMHGECTEMSLDHGDSGVDDASGAVFAGWLHPPVVR